MELNKFPSQIEAECGIPEIGIEECFSGCLIHSDCLTEVLFSRTTKRKHINWGTFNSVCLIHCLTVVSYIQVKLSEGPISFSSFITILHQVVFGLPLFPLNWSPSQGYFWYPFISNDWASSVLGHVIFSISLMYYTVYTKSN